MNIDELRIRQAEFEGERQILKKSFSEKEKLQLEFINKFPISKLASLPIEKYVVGENKDSFCYWLEHKLFILGNIKGGSTALNKFGVYFGRTKYEEEKKYRFLPKFGKSAEEAYNSVRNEIVGLVKAGEAGDIATIEENKLSPMFKGKILSTYFPNKYLNIFAYSHLDYFIEMLALPIDTINLKEVEKRKVLVDFKNSNAVMKDWTLYEFSSFLYYGFGRPANPQEAHENLREYLLPSLDQVQPGFVELYLNDVVTSPHKYSEHNKPYKPDYEKENKANRELGLRGENLVYMEEKKCLEQAGHKELASQVDHVSLRDDGRGYDIESYDEDGRKKYIEVKSTNADISAVSFTITSHELESSKRLENYYIYIVFRANSLAPKIFKLKNPTVLPEAKIKFFPVRYRALINPSENKPK